MARSEERLKCCFTAAGLPGTAASMLTASATLVRDTSWMPGVGRSTGRSLHGQQIKSIPSILPSVSIFAPICNVIPLEKGMVTPLSKPIHFVHSRASREVMVERSHFHKALVLLILRW